MVGSRPDLTVRDAEAVNLVRSRLVVDRQGPARVANFGYTAAGDGICQ
jgi:hypothetical protein